MKILFIDSHYPSFLRQFYRVNSDLKSRNYKHVLLTQLRSFFGTPGLFSHNLNKLGWMAEDIIANDEVLQKKWAKENNIQIKDNRFISFIQTLPLSYKYFGKPRWVQEIAVAQIKKFKPDIIYVQDLSILNPETLRQVKQYCSLLVGQIASPLPPDEYLKCFDLIVTSFPHYVKRFKKMGIESEYHSLAFDKRILKEVGELKRIYDVTFVGSFSPYHLEGTKILEKVALKVPIQVWGNGVQFLSPNSPLKKNYHGEAWGIDMFKILAKSKIVINRHIKVADGFANNMRLFEATGVGAMLITDNKKNINNLFTVGKEIVTYSNANDLIRKIEYYLKDSDERERIAQAGQKRTLKDHSYETKMKELKKILLKHAKKRQ